MRLCGFTLRGPRQITWVAGLDAPAPGCVRFGIFPSRTRCSLHAAPAIAAVTRALANSIRTLFAPVPSSTGGACRYFLPLLRPGVQSPRRTVGDAGDYWSYLVSMIYKSQPTWRNAQDHHGLACVRHCETPREQCDRG